jgi:hypothetical protein
MRHHEDQQGKQGGEFHGKKIQYRDP